MMTAIYHWPCWIVFLLLLFAPALTHTTTHLKLHFRMNSCLSSYSPPLLPLCIIRVFSRYMMILIIILYNQSRLLVFFFNCVPSSLLLILSFSAPLPFYCIKKTILLEFCWIYSLLVYTAACRVPSMCENIT